LRPNLRKSQFSRLNLLKENEAGDAQTDQSLFLMEIHAAMRIVRFLSLFLIVSSPLVCAAAQAQSNPPKPATKIESFEAKTGIVLVRGFTTVGKINGLGGQITIDARDFRDAANPGTHVSGISISIKETGELERENTSFIDADEVDSLLTGLSYISKANKDMTKLEQFEVEYRTKGDFSVTVFNQSNGNLSVAVSSGSMGKTTSYLKLEKLPELVRLVTLAKSKIGELQ
jgi:hypothetical protein